MTSLPAIDRGRSAFDEHRWRAAFDAFREADRDHALAAADLERMSTAALLLGDEEQGIDLATRAHEAFLDVDDVAGACRCATWIGLYLGGKGDGARSGGWLARARRVAASNDDGTASPKACCWSPPPSSSSYGGDPVTARSGVRRRLRSRGAIRTIGTRWRWRSSDRGRRCSCSAIAGAGLALLDEAMVAVTAGEISPVASGIVYCSVIGTCHLAFDVRRAHEWTIALEHWCGERPDMVLFTGQCQAHRAALYCLHGAWGDAMAAAREAQKRVRSGDWSGAFGAWYQEAEVHRLRGEFDEADRAYRPCRRGRLPAAARPRPAPTRAGPGAGCAGAAPRCGRARRPGDQASAVRGRRRDRARDGRRGGGARRPPMSWPRRRPSPRSPCCGPWRRAAMRRFGSRKATRGERSTSCVSPGGCCRSSTCPYEAAQCRVLAARAWRALGDDDSASMDLDAARAVFVELEAVPDVLAVDALSLSRTTARRTPTTLTPREIDVVRLVAEGKTNRAIAGELYLSEKTVDRHLSNVFAKLGISSRAAATAYAYEHALI